MFTKCIENSLFQPEPDAPIRTVACVRQTAVGSELTTVPETSLSAGLHKGSSESAKASELLRHMMRSTMRSRTEGEAVLPTTEEQQKEPSDSEPADVGSETKDSNKENTGITEEEEIVENEAESNSDAAQALERKANYDVYKRLEFNPVSHPSASLLRCL